MNDKRVKKGLWRKVENDCPKCRLLSHALSRETFQEVLASKACAHDGSDKLYGWRRSSQLQQKHVLVAHCRYARAHWFRTYIDSTCLAHTPKSVLSGESRSNSSSWVRQLPKSHLRHMQRSIHQIGPFNLRWQIFSAFFIVYNGLELLA